MRQLGLYGAIMRVEIGVKPIAEMIALMSAYV